MLYGGSIPPGRFQGHDVTILDVFEAVGAHAAGQDERRGARRARGGRQPGRRRLRRPVHRQHDGHGLRGDGHQPDARSSMVPAQEPTQGRGRPRGRAAGHGRAARAACGPATSSPASRWRTRSPRSPASGGSTNGVLHLLAVARESGVELDIDDFDRISERTPLLCDLKPGGAYNAVDLYHAGGVPRARSSACSEAGVLHADALTVDRQDDRRARRRRRPETEGQQVVRAARRPAQAHRRPGHPARQPRARGLRRQARRPRAPPPRGPGARLRGRGGGDGRGHARRHPAGDVVVIRNEGPVGGPGMREMLAVTGAINGAGPRRARRADDRRALLRRHPRLHGRPRRARGRPRRPDRRGPATATRSPSTSTPAASTSTSPDEEIAARVAAYEAPANPDAHRRAGQVRRAGRPAPSRGRRSTAVR